MPGPAAVASDEFANTTRPFADWWASMIFSFNIQLQSERILLLISLLFYSDMISFSYCR